MERSACVGRLVMFRVDPDAPADMQARGRGVMWSVLEDQVYRPITAKGAQCLRADAFGLPAVATQTIAQPKGGVATSL